MVEQPGPGIRGLGVRVRIGLVGSVSKSQNSTLIEHRVSALGITESLLCTPPIPA